MKPSSSLDLFKQHPDRVSKYQEALRLLLDAGVDVLLKERSCGVPISSGPDIMVLSALAHHQSLGYQAAVFDLFNLLEIESFDDRPLPAPDFGATERLKSRGINIEDEE